MKTVVGMEGISYQNAAVIDYTMARDVSIVMSVLKTLTVGIKDVAWMCTLQQLLGGSATVSLAGLVLLAQKVSNED